MENQETPSYAVIGLDWSGKEKTQLLCAKDGRVVVCDAPFVAADLIVGRLGEGIPGVWDVKKETYTYLLISENTPLRAHIITPYDIYNLPPNWPIPSESHSLDWKSHIHWQEWIISERAALASESPS